MGVCSARPVMPSGDPELNHSAMIDNVLRSDSFKDERIPRILLLGSGESGKSTVFKQLQIIHGDGLVSQQRHLARTMIYNIVDCMIILIEECLKLNCAQSTIPQSYSDDVDHVLYSSHHPVHVVGNSVAKLWELDSIQFAFKSANLVDQAAYFLAKSRTIMHTDYLPSNEDMLRSWHRTTGTNEAVFNMGENLSVLVIDVGGQRSERRKWIHSWFDGISAILWVASLSEYDQPCFEDPNSNRLEESLALFEVTVNETFFERTALILFLNKVDVFQRKLEASPLQNFQPTYIPHPDNELNSACKFIESLYCSRVTRGSSPVFTHVTTATDTTNMRKILDAIKFTLLNEALDSSNIF